MEHVNWQYDVCDMLQRLHMLNSACQYGLMCVSQQNIKYHNRIFHPRLQALIRRECGLEVAVGPAQLVTSAYWTLRGASAFVAGKLGTTVTHVLQQHSMLHMTNVSLSNIISLKIVYIGYLFVEGLKSVAVSYCWRLLVTASANAAMSCCT